MARKPRLHYPGAVYHVMLRGNGGQDIFFHEEDQCYLYQLLEEGIERYGHRIHAFCCMTNHIHLAVQVADTPLSRILQNLSFRYARWINRQQGKMGHLFQGRYKALLVDADRYLLELTRYIHLNPLRADLVHDLEDHPWSGHRAYLGQERLSWFTTEWVLSQFSMQLDLARQGYRQFVEEGKSEGYRREFHSGAREGRLLGNDAFLEKALNRAGQQTGSEVDLEKILAVVCKAYDLSEADLFAAGKGRHASQARATVAWMIRELPQITLTELSNRVNRDVTTLSVSVNRLLERSRIDKVLAQQLERIRKDLLGMP